MTSVKERDCIISETVRERTVMVVPVSISKPVPETCSDWRRETEETSGQSFYWSECPLDASTGGSEDY